ncbi:hypothetical protein HHI36_010845 [Cryptolaemus montrouzieri]|uniref:Uncharacterized protein n=1 Tax=Cryptolaemus montrouzieri TaxID=559131 RepID=A0ABD2MK01_9CUCU
MIVICVCFAILIATVFSIVGSKKPLDLIISEVKYEVIYNIIGTIALLQDWFMRHNNKTELISQPNKIAVITGGARGIGAEVIKMLLKCDITVVIGCRNIESALVMLRKYRDQGIDTGDLDPHQLDITSSDSVSKFVTAVKEKYPKINYLINNAGIMFGPRKETRDGYESQFSTNYLGHFQLTHLLFECLKQAGEENSFSRIVNVSSCAHIVGKINFIDINSRLKYVSTEAYAQSKLAQILFTNYLDSLCIREGHQVQVHSVHPGIVNTELFDGTLWKKVAPWLPNLIFKTPKEGAIPIVHACLSPKLERKGGTYIHNCKIFPTNRLARDKELQKKMFDFTNSLIGIKQFGKS